MAWSKEMKMSIMICFDNISLDIINDVYQLWSSALKRQSDANIQGAKGYSQGARNYMKMLQCQYFFSPFMYF